jgi:hypothetical protein
MAHIEIHNKFRKSQTFEALPDNIKQVFEAHVQLHIMSSQPQQMMGDPNMMPGQEQPMGGNMPPEQPPMGGAQLPPPEGM